MSMDTLRMEEMMTERVLQDITKEILKPNLNSVSTLTIKNSTTSKEQTTIAQPNVTLTYLGKNNKIKNFFKISLKIKKIN